MSRECWALVTGASRGLGRAAARGLARRRCSLVLLARNPRGLREAAEEAERLGSPRALAVPGDLRLEWDAEEAARRLLRESGGKPRLVFMSYGNPSCEPSRLGEEAWSCWLEAAAMYLASTSRILRVLAEGARERFTLAAVTSFTVAEPHEPLIVADAVRRGLSTILWAAPRRWPGRVQTVLVVLGSFPTPGARETIGLIHPATRFEDFWRESVEPMSPLRRAGREEDLDRLLDVLLGLPEYVLYTPIYLEGGSLRGPHTTL